MLHLILGIAGTGKTTQLHEKIQACVENGGKAILIVPEQYSFESEKALYRRLGAQRALAVEVLSFTRLCDRIFRELGGLAGVYMDDTAKYLLMSVALGELGGGLHAYRKNSGSAAFVSSMCETVSELKTAGASPELLRQAAKQTSDSGFADKLEDIALIFETYQAIIDRGYSDPDDSLARACKKLEGAPFFSEYEVFIDGFMAFMGGEWKLLEQILAQSSHVWVTLTCQSLAENSKTGVFSAPTRTANRLVELARRAGSHVAAPVVLQQPYRFQNPALAHLAQDFPKLRHTAYEQETQGVACIQCEDPYDELEYIAAQISALVRQGWRYRDFALIGRSLERYLVPLQTVFARYDIPFFTDLRADVQVYPLVSGLLAALEAVRSGFDTTQMLMLAKNCITGIDRIEAAMLENYVFVWGVSGKGWTQEFVNHPEGMVEQFTAQQTEKLAQINAVRTKLVQPLERLKNGLRNCDGKGFALAIFQYLEQCGAAENLQASAQEMPDELAKPFLETGAQVWDLLIGLLDVFGGALAGVRQPLQRLIDLFRLSVATADIGELPQTLDQVIVGTADRIRPNEPRGVFVIGLNEGEFPLWGSTGGIFSAIERDRLKEQGVDLLRTPEQSALFERYFVYFALTQSSERLWMSYPQKTTAGAALAPSSAMEQAAFILGIDTSSTASLPALERVSNRKTAFDLLTRGWRDSSKTQAVLRAYFAQTSPQWMEQLETFCGVRSFRLRDRQNARALFGGQMRISPSRVEEYYNCPFSYFCRSGLKLKPRRRAEFNPMESGSIIHLVLEKVVRQYGGKGLAAVPDEQLRAEISHIIQQDLSAKITDFEGMPARFKFLFGRLVNTTFRLVRRLALEFAQSEFEPVAFELPIEMDAQVQPLELYAANGTRVIVEGVVDRVDVLNRGGQRFVRVVDYKSGRKLFNLSDVYYGLNLQMLIYLFSICEMPAPPDRIPAGVLYMPAKDSIISAERSASEDEIYKEQLKKLKMNGILLEDYEVLSAMEPGLAGVFIPVKTKKDGSFSAASSLATLAQMGYIQRKVEQLLTGLADALYEGRIDAVPAEHQGMGPCGWCDYHSICTHEDDDTVRKLAELSREEALERMKEEDND